MKIVIVYTVIRRPTDERTKAGHAITLCMDRYSSSMDIH